MGIPVKNRLQMCDPLGIAEHFRASLQSVVVSVEPEIQQYYGTTSEVIKIAPLNEGCTKCIIVRYESSDLIEVAVMYQHQREEFLLFVEESSGNVAHDLGTFIARVLGLSPSALAQGARIRDVVEYHDIAGLY